MKNVNQLLYDIDYISGVMSLRNPQKDSLIILDDIFNNVYKEKQIDKKLALDYIHQKYPICSDFERSFPSITFALATGVGKTRLMGAFITYLYTNHDVKNYLVVAPNTTIFEKLKLDLGAQGTNKYVFNSIGCFNGSPRIITDDNYAYYKKDLFNSEVNIFIYNISKFDKDNTKMKSFNENLGMSFYDTLAEIKDLVIIMDESHHYRAEKGMSAINELKPIIGLELTATPVVNVKSKQVPFKNVVYEYPLSKAIRDGYTRVPYAVTRSDIDLYNFGDEATDRLMLSDGLICHELIKEKLKAYCNIHNLPIVKPFMLVVCKDTEHASIIEKYIKSDDFAGGQYKNKTIIINSKMSGAETEANTKLLLSVEQNDNPIEIVIHVNMLKEGWDVNNLYTIVPLRTASSKILREQMVGRGLRLPFGKRTGEKEIDSVMLTAHDKFKEIIEEAQKGDSLFNRGNIIEIEELENQKTEITQLSISIDDKNKELKESLNINDEKKKEKFTDKVVSILVNNVERCISISNSDNLSKEEVTNIKEFVKKELQDIEDYGKIFEDNVNPLSSWMDDNIDKIHKETIEKFIVIPRIKTESEPGEYYFDEFDLNLDRFNNKPIENELLIKNLTDFSDIERLQSGYINFDAYNPKKVILEELRKKAEINYEKDSELLFKLITQVTDKYQSLYEEDGMKNIIMMHKKEISLEIYNQMMEHFVRNEGLIHESVIDFNRHNLKSNYTYNIKKSIFDKFDSERDGRITSILFDGIKRGVFKSAKFDSEPELIFAQILESESNLVYSWLRPSRDEFEFLTYNNGRRYEPDFVVETVDMTYLVEIKADNQLEDIDVLAKKERAISYCKIVSEWAKSSKNKEWRHLFIPASKIKESTTLNYLINNYIGEQ